MTPWRRLAYSDGVFFGPFDFDGFGGCDVGSFAAAAKGGSGLSGRRVSCFAALAELPRRNFTYDPGASSSTLSFPSPGMRAATLSPPNPLIHPSHSFHHEPS